MKDIPLISIILVEHYYYSKKFLDSLKSYFDQNYKNLEFVIVFWGKGENPNNFKIKLREISKSEVNVSIIELRGDPGYAKGNNLGVKYANGEYIMITNPDVIVPKDFITHILKSYFYLKKLLKTDKIILGPRICNYGTNYEHSRRIINFLGFSNIDISKTNKIRRTQITSGCNFLIRKKDFLNLNGFDSSYFMYHEDADFSIRAEMQDFKQYVDNSIELYHLRAPKNIKLTKFKYYYHERNRIIMTIEHSKRKNKMIISHLMFEPIHLFYAFIKGFLFERFKIYKYIIHNYAKLMNTSNKENRLFDNDYDLSGIFYEINSKGLLLKILNFYSKMIFYLYHN
ncbi:MAG: glycosyltransferase [Candidatus Lokiarchaeota archaeon]|nr:glycosyltransferase [Candidatus Lokiarchaeota archaeon]